MMKVILLVLCLFVVGPRPARAQASLPNQAQERAPQHEMNPIDEVKVVLVRLPVAALWVIESFEPRARNFDLKIKVPGNDTDALRPKIEPILNRYKLTYELRTSSDEEVCYDVQVPFDVQTDRISNAIQRLDRDGHA